MEMTRFEKFFVNRELKGRRNAARIERLLEQAGVSGVQDVLEIGCGIGTASAQFARENGWFVTGTDYDGEQVESAKRRYSGGAGLLFQREDATQLSFADDSFDLAIAQMVFHHIPAWPSAVREFGRVVRPGGWVAWYDLVLSESAARFVRPLARYFGICSREGVAEAFAEAGFEAIASNRVGLPSLSFDDVLYRKAN
jgi:ubiquinone/menaquinone biosynthesis C-methylase UbiE